ncbi:MAG: efflux RND transporter periplasmic adaptor subunit [Planctomycetota bacterium]
MSIPKSRYLILGAAVLAAVVLGGVGAGRALRGAEVEGAKGAKGVAPAKGGGGGGLFGGGGGHKRVETAKPRRGTIVTTIESPGTIQAGSEVGIGAAFEGRVLELCKDTGDAVKEGEVVFRLDPTDHAEAVKEAELELERRKAALEEARAERGEAERKAKELEQEPSDVTDGRLRARQSELALTRARAQLDSAQATLARSRGMLADGIGREADVESAESEQRVSSIGVRIADQELSLAKETLAFRLTTWKRNQAEAGKTLLVNRTREKRAEADLRAGELTLEQKRRDLERCYIRSPLDGIVTGRGVNQGDLVARLAGGTSHYIISDLAHLLLYVDVDEGDVVNVHRGQPAKVNVTALGYRSRLEAAVYDVGYRATQANGEQVSTFRVRVLLAPDQEGLDRLRPGMNGSATIETQKAEDALKVPLQAFLQRQRDELPKDLKLPDGLDQTLKEAKGADALLDVVFVLQDGKARLRVVRRGLADEDEAQVTAGLEPDAEVVVGPFRTLDKLEDGEAVTGELVPDLLPPDPAGGAEAGAKTPDTHTATSGTAPTTTAAGG